MSLLNILAATAIVAAVHLAPLRPGYVVDTANPCDGYPRLPIETASGVCAGLVFGPPPGGQRLSQRVLRLPRTLLFLPDGDLLVVDLGGWDSGQGAVWRLKAPPGRVPTLTKLLSGLDLPHTAAIGPDGDVYLGEMSRIIRFDPGAPNPASTVQTVVAGLPANHLHDDRHPLSSFIFDRDGSLLVNVGAPSDQCAPAPGAPAATNCAASEGDPPLAAIWRFAYLGQGRWDQTPTTFARGLRNSVALVRHSSGTLLQAENGIDVDDPDFPYDVINRLRPGADYGWPYCVETDTRAPLWRGAGGRDCAGSWRAAPILFLPPHGAPLSMVYYQGPMFPQLEGDLLISLHGFRATGSRILAYPVDASGAPLRSVKARFAVYSRDGAAPIRRRYRPGPAADGLIVTPGWDAVAGLRPAGAPVGMAVAADGALWVADDRNGAVLRFARDSAAGPHQRAGPSSPSAGQGAP